MIILSALPLHLKISQNKPFKKIRWYKWKSKNYAFMLSKRNEICQTHNPNLAYLFEPFELKTIVFYIVGA